VPKRCGFCDFSTEDETAFADHMRSVHRWGLPPASVSTATTAPGLAPPLVAGGPAEARFCGNCGAPRDSLSTNFCRNCGASFASSTPATQPASPAFAAKAGFWKRANAYVLDSILILVLSFAVGLVLGVMGAIAKVPRDQLNAIANVVGSLLGLGYFLYFWSRWGHGQTPGMRWQKLRLIRTDGGELSVPRAFLRWIGLTLGSLALFLGVLWVAWDRNKQGWHDKLADTYVVMAA
jgi:uncharacterized RDD family membrane protein YckC